MKKNTTYSYQLSPVKIVSLEICLICLAALPMISGFGQNLSYTSIFYQGVGRWILTFSCSIMGLFALIILPLLYNSLLKIPFMEITSSSIYIRNPLKKKIPIENLVSSEGPRFGNLIIKLKSGKYLSIPLFLFSEQSDALNKLTSIVKDIRV